jgi:hypothetical protein
MFVGRKLGCWVGFGRNQMSCQIPVGRLLIFQMPWVVAVKLDMSIVLEVCDRQPLWYTGQISATGHTWA